mmetsp:Transcript_117915/g.220452  ORF Transcript_117915/g.220452 Transcript_117915/m.220452 type:complete len:90 (-) Transcript_117915:139-408(-)
MKIWTTWKQFTELTGSNVDLHIKLEESLPTLIWRTSEKGMCAEGREVILSLVSVTLSEEGQSLNTQWKARDVFTEVFTSACDPSLGIPY